MNNLGVLYRWMGNPDAESCFRQAWEIQRRALGDKHAAIADTLNNIAVLHDEMGDYLMARRFYKQAIATYRSTLGEKHPKYGLGLHNLAMLLHAMGDYGRAEPLYRQASEIWRVAFGQTHPNLAISLYNLARLCAATGREAEACEYFRQVAAMHDEAIREIFSFGSENERMAYLAIIRTILDGYLSLIVLHTPAVRQAVPDGLDAVLRRKGIGAEALAAQRDAVLGGRYLGLRSELQKLTALRRRIARKALDGPGREGQEGHRRLLAEWSAEKDQVEAALVRQIPEINLARKLRVADRHAIASALPAGAALVEFVHFDAFDFGAVPARGELQWKPARYLAFVLPSGEADAPRLVDLGEAEPIDRLVVRVRAAMAGGRDLTVKTAKASPGGGNDGSDLRARVFDPLVKVLGESTRLFLAPDGELARLPFESLPTVHGRRLIDDYLFSYVGTGRDLLRFGTPASAGAGEALVAADPDLTSEATAWQGALHRGPGVARATSREPGCTLVGSRARGERASRSLAFSGVRR